MRVGNHEIVVTGKAVRIACFKSEWYKLVEDPLSTIKALSHDNHGADIFTFAQKPPDIVPKYDYYMEWDNAAIIPIVDYESWWTKQTTKNNRKRVRKAQNRGIEIRRVGYTDEFIGGIEKIYNETPVRQGRRFWHYGKSFEAVKKENSGFLERTDFIGAYYNDELVGFVALVYTGQCGDLMQILTKIEYRNKFTSNALIAKAVELCAQKNIKYLIYGNFFYGKKGADSLNIFKIRNGFQKMDFPRYYIPLTLRGKFALKFHLHHGLGEILPKFIVIFLLKMREKWYLQKYGTHQDIPEEE